MKATGDSIRPWLPPLFRLFSLLALAHRHRTGRRGQLHVDQHQLGAKYSPLTQINRDNVGESRLGLGIPHG